MFLWQIGHILNIKLLFKITIVSMSIFQGRQVVRCHFLDNYCYISVHFLSSSSSYLYEKQYISYSITLVYLHTYFIFYSISVMYQKYLNTKVCLRITSLIWGTSFCLPIIYFFVGYIGYLMVHLHCLVLVCFIVLLINYIRVYR